MKERKHCRAGLKEYQLKHKNGLQLTYKCIMGPNACHRCGKTEEVQVFQVTYGVICMAFHQRSVDKSKSTLSAATFISTLDSR